MAMLNKVYLEISNICNLQCTFCPVVDRDKKVMDPGNFAKILSQVKPLTKEVCLHLMGEPLAHPNFSKVMSICEEQAVPIQITTNGIVLAKKQELLLASKVLRQINFSVQSFKDNFPHKDFRTYLLPLLNFAKEALAKRPDLYINFRIWNVGRNERVLKENEEFFQILENFFDIHINRNIQVESIKSKKLIGRMYLHFDSHFDWPSWQNPHQGENGRCHALSTHIGIHADGTVVPCCLDKEAQIPLGNCLDQDISEILNSDRAQRMLTGFKNHRLIEKFCQHCTYIKRFSK